MFHKRDILNAPPGSSNHISDHQGFHGTCLQASISDGRSLEAEWAQTALGQRVIVDELTDVQVGDPHEAEGVKTTARETVQADKLLVWMTAICSGIMGVIWKKLTEEIFLLRKQHWNSPRSTSSTFRLKVNSKFHYPQLDLNSQPLILFQCPSTFISRPMLSTYTFGLSFTDYYYTLHLTLSVQLGKDQLHWTINANNPNHVWFSLSSRPFQSTAGWRPPPNSLSGVLAYSRCLPNACWWESQGRNLEIVLGAGDNSTTIWWKTPWGSLTSIDECLQTSHPAWCPSDGRRTLWCNAVPVKHQDDSL